MPKKQPTQITIYRKKHYLDDKPDRCFACGCSIYTDEQYLRTFQCGCKLEMLFEHWVWKNTCGPKTWEGLLWYMAKHQNMPPDLKPIIEKALKLAAKKSY